MQSNDYFAPVESELFVATVDGAGLIAFRNPAWTRVLGTDDDPWSHFEAADAAEARRLLERARGGELLTNQLFLVPTRGSDHPQPLLLHFLPLVHGDGQAGPVTITGELLVQPESWTSGQTERRRMETLGRMTMGMAHDFNNLLSAILGHVELMRLGAGASAAGLEEHLETIERAARDGASLVERVQRYIRQEQQAAYGPVDLPSLIQDCISLTRPYWYNEPRRQGIDIGVERHLADVPPVKGSASELRDVLVNMVLNAVQAMPEGGVISFRTWTEGPQVCLSVADNGVGMTESVQARVFEPLFTTKGERGNGMGLAVAYGVVQEHGGSISVDSRLGEGTTMTVRLPVTSHTAVDASVVSPPDIEDRVRILVVDDESMVRTVLRRLLGLRGHEVVEAVSGPDALTCLARESFDVIITDQGMPGMNGRELARQIRQQGYDAPVILLTGDTHGGEADESIRAVLFKPFRIEDVEAAVLSVL